MARESYNAQEAQAALKNSLNNNQELVDKVNQTNEKVASAFTASGDSLKGALGEAAANCWGDGTGDFFSKNLSQKTEEFLSNRVPQILASMDEFTNSTEQAYSQAAHSNGTTNQ